MTALRCKHHALIVGVGSIGERHLRCFLATGRATASFVEVDDSLRARIADRYGVRGFADLDAALHDDPPPDLAVVATPAPLHTPIARRLVDAGLHVLIEKPLSTTTDGVEQLGRLAESNAVCVAVAYVYRCFPALAAMRESLLSGRFGEPLELVAVSGQNFPTYRPAYRETYYTDRKTGGGAVQDALTHLLNAGEWLVGPIDRVVADVERLALEGVDVEDTVHLLARHGKVLASYSLNQHQAPNETTLTVVCRQGVVRWEAHAGRWRWTTRPEEPWTEEPFEALPRDAAFIAQANRFMDAVEGIAASTCSLAEGLQTLCVNLAALASADSGAWVRVEAMR